MMTAAAVLVIAREMTSPCSPEKVNCFTSIGASMLPPTMPPGNSAPGPGLIGLTPSRPIVNDPAWA